jgi:hypothetical protein
MPAQALLSIVAVAIIVTRIYVTKSHRKKSSTPGGAKVPNSTSQRPDAGFSYARH